MKFLKKHEKIWKIIIFHDFWILAADSHDFLVHCSKFIL